MQQIQEKYFGVNNIVAVKDLIFGKYILPASKKEFSESRALDHLQDPEIWKQDHRVICHVLAAIYDLATDDKTKTLTLEATIMAMRMQQKLDKYKEDQ